MVIKGEKREGMKLKDWDWPVYTTVYKIDNQWGPTELHRELYAMLVAT